MATPLRLNCWVLGDDSTRIFPVEIHRDKNVGDLKEAIKEKNPRALDRVDAKDLDLWKVDIPIGEDTNLQVQINDLRLHEKKPLWSVKSLQRTFKDLDEETLHVVIKAPPIITTQASSLLRLNCLVLGENSARIFPVEIHRDKNVGALKDAIKEKKKPAFDDITADSLDVWKVDILIGEDTNLQIQINDLRLHEKKPLRSVKSLQTTFKDLDEETLHVVIKAPPITPYSVAALDPTQLLSINCLVLGDKQNEAFTVEVLKTKNVSILKDEIKKKKAHRLDHIDASKLNLTQVSLALDDNLEENLKTVDLVPLPPLSPISQIFAHLEENRLHVVVQAPPEEGSTTSGAGQEGKRDQIDGLHQRYRNLISNILKAAPPSDSAKSSTYPKSQLAYSIYDGRYKADTPRSSVAPPVQLFNPAFGHFLDHMRSDDPIPDDIVQQTAKYMLAASAIYDNEDMRRGVLNPLLKDVLDIDIQAIKNADQTIPDGIVEHFDAEKKTRSLHYLQEDKNEYGDGSSDPATQTGLSMGRCWAQSRFDVVRDATGCPTFLIATAGPWFVVLGAVMTDGLIVQRLTNSVWVGLDCILNDAQIAHVARVFWALRMSLRTLKLYYAGVNPSGDRPAASRYFPSITAYRDGEEVVEFEYIGFFEEEPECVTLHARTRTTPSQDIVVKFVDRYGERAHRLLADADLAPKLLYCGSPQLENDQPSYQSISMIVMEYIDGDTLARAKRTMDEGTIAMVRSEVRRAIAMLHDHGFVFGDLRPPNVMITKAGKVKLIDFNWPGEDSQAKYPPLMSKGISWPHGVEPLAVMKREHDLAMFGKLFANPESK